MLCHADLYLIRDTLNDVLALSPEINFCEENKEHIPCSLYDSLYDLKELCSNDEVARATVAGAASALDIALLVDK
jgi:hypothetical protein